MKNETIKPANFSSMAKQLTRDPMYILRKQFPSAPLPTVEQFAAAVQGTWEHQISVRASELVGSPEADASECFSANAANVCERCRRRKLF